MCVSCLFMMATNIIIIKVFHFNEEWWIFFPKIRIQANFFWVHIKKITWLWKRGNQRGSERNLQYIHLNHIYRNCLRPHTCQHAPVGSEPPDRASEGRYLWEGEAAARPLVVLVGALELQVLPLDPPQHPSQLLLQLQLPSGGHNSQIKEIRDDAACKNATVNNQRLQKVFFLNKS